MAKHKRNKADDMMDEPTPRFRYEGNVHPILGVPVFRTDGVGLMAARREIMRFRGQNHPALAHIDAELEILQSQAVAENQVPN